MNGIVIAEDHALFRRGLEAVLIGSGLTVSRAVADGDEALAAISELDPDVLVLDLRMPHRDGLSTLRTMRARGDERPVVVLAAEIDDAALLGLMAARADAILLKNGSEFRLFDAIKAVREGAKFFDAELIDRAFSIQRKPWNAHLSEREIALCRAVADGLRNQEIAERFGTTLSTVKIYLHRIYGKVGVGSRRELAEIVNAGSEDG